MKYKLFAVIIALLLALTACQGAPPPETGQTDPTLPAATQWNEGMEQNIKQILARFADINGLTPNAGFFSK